MIMKKLSFFVLIIFLCSFFVVFVNAQETITATTPSQLDAVVVKEHFKTKEEIKQYMDKKSIEYNQYAEEVIIKSLNEVKLIFSDQVNKTLFKLILAVLGIILFAQTIWYFLRLKLDQKKMLIMDLRRPVIERSETPIVKEKPVKQALKQEKQEEKPLIEPEKKKTWKELRKERMDKKEQEKQLKKENKEQLKEITPTPDDFEDFKVFKEWKKLNSK